MFVCVAAHTQPQRLSSQQQNRVRPLLLLPETLRSLVHSRTRTLNLSPFGLHLVLFIVRTTDTSPWLTSHAKSQTKVECPSPAGNTLCVKR